MDKLKVICTVDRPIDIVRSCFWDIEKWNSIWQKIETVKVLYQNPVIQEFQMKVWRNDILENIRSIRFLEENGIDFFSPDPPPMMKWHQGQWLFSKVNDNQTLVTAQRQYELKDSTNATEFKKNFRNRLNKILNSL